MYLLAYITLLLALLLALGGAGLAIIQLWEGRADQARLVGLANWPISACLLLASALLLHALFWQDYRLEYVASYTDSWLPVFYRLTAFWAGQPGSMLFWALITALCGSIFAPFLKRQEPQTRLWYWTLFYLNMAFFCLILTCWSNPFILQEPVPADGNGLNPLLQNPGMIIHPPLLFMGYAGFTVPACLGLAQLVAPNAANPPWHAQSRPFYLISWLLLSAGIILGAWWAYMELGWGGYWAWDPVENASLLPWLISTAALHIMVITRRSNALSRYAVALMALTVIAAFFATYLTRSGVIQSVHAFGDGGVGTPLTIFVLVSLLISFYMILFSPADKSQLASLGSREGILVIVSWLLLALAAVITLATMWPVISKIWGAAAQGLDASFYNRVCLPLAVGLILLICICPGLRWKGGIAHPASLYATCGAFVAASAGIWFAGYQKPLAVVGAGAAIAAICAILLTLLQKNVWSNPKRLAALGAHFGTALMALGVAFSGPYTLERDLLLAKGQSENAGPYTVSLETVREGAGPGYDFLQATLKISRNTEQIGTLKPERRIYEKFGDMQFSEVDVIPGLGSDIYASLLGMDEDLRVLVRISLEPLVNWIWIGGVLMCLLPLVGLWRKKTNSNQFESSDKPAC